MFHPEIQEVAQPALDENPAVTRSQWNTNNLLVTAAILKNELDDDKKQDVDGQEVGTKAFEKPVLGGVGVIDEERVGENQDDSESSDSSKFNKSSSSGKGSSKKGGSNNEKVI